MNAERTSLDQVRSELSGSPGRTARIALSLGWLAKGGLFVVIGLLAIEIARRGYSSEDADQTGAIASVSTVFAGRALVFTLAVGLTCYAVWQLWAAITNREMTDPLGIAKRIGWVGLAIAYGLLAQTAFVIALADGLRSAEDDNGPTSPTGIAVRLFEVPGGRLLVGAIGIGTVAVGGYNAWKGLSGDHLDDIDTHDIDTDDIDAGGNHSNGTREWHRGVLRVLGVSGFMARAVLLAIAGWLLIDAAMSYAPERAAGIDESLHELARASHGTVLLAVTGVGLMAAGAYDMVTFRRQRVEGE